MAAQSKSSLYFFLLVWRRRVKARPGEPSGKTFDLHFEPEVEVDFQVFEIGGPRARNFRVSSHPLPVQRPAMRSIRGAFGVTRGGAKFEGPGLVHGTVGRQLCSPFYVHL